MDTVKPHTYDVAAVRSALDSQGYIVLPDVVSKDVLARFARHIVEMYERAPKFKGGGMLTGTSTASPAARRARRSTMSRRQGSSRSRTSSAPGDRTTCGSR